LVCTVPVVLYSTVFTWSPHSFIILINFVRSACPKGWTGLLCEIPMMICGNKQASSICLNGGICTPSRNSSNFHCDCSNINPNGKGNHSRWNSSSSSWSDRLRHHGNWSFGGKSCQTPASTLCPVPTNVPNPLDFFCANGGTCPPISAYATAYCTCPTGMIIFLRFSNHYDRYNIMELVHYLLTNTLYLNFIGFTGPRCEYKDTSPLKRNCTLDCQNNGKCFFGVKDYNTWEDIANIDISQGTNKEGMFCQCPPGYGGLLCDSAIELCSASEQFACFNKAKCTKNNGIRSCNCTAASNGFEKQFAGNQCQFAASSWCEGKHKQPTAFCTNGGTCKSAMEFSPW